MSRPLRIAFDGAIFHVTSRGNKRATIFLDTRDYQSWLGMLADTAEKHHLIVHAYCLMPNHFHMVVETPNGNLSAAMHHLNSNYCQAFNKRYDLSGHVLQGRYHAEMVNRESHVLELARYLPLNPVRAGLVASAEEWRWSSYRQMLGKEPPAPWLATEWLLSQFGNGTREHQLQAYIAFVREGIGKPDPMAGRRSQYAWLPSPAPTLAEFQAEYKDRNEAARRAFETGAYTKQAIARYFGVSLRTINRLLRARPAPLQVPDPDRDTDHPIADAAPGA